MTATFAPDYNVAKKKTNPADDVRDRVDLRADPAWLRRVLRQAKRLMGGNLTAYIREAITRKLEADEATDPDA